MFIQFYQMSEQSCNGNIFRYPTSSQQAYLYVVIGISSAILVYFFFRMCKLCSYAFSYSNYHIHQTYKLYALSIISIISTIMVRKSQLDLYDTQNYNIEHKGESYIDPSGFYIINDLLGIVSILTSNIVSLFNAFTWFTIALNCDFTVSNESKLHTEEQVLKMSETTNYSTIVANKKIVKIARLYFLYCFLPMLLVMSLFGTLNHRSGDSWCDIVIYCMFVSSMLPLIIFCIAFALYLKKFADPEVSKKTKAGLIYLLVALIVRSIYILIFLIKKGSYESSGDIVALLYVIFCTLTPMMVMTFLSEIQLHNQQYTRNIILTES